ncbi:MAG: CHASE2 domain-containing protein [Cyanothece sp. SIO2G6]|nr:CHASE2 domain-containing protein [Cyanothece sp. SIO2G6]
MQSRTVSLLSPGTILDGRYQVGALVNRGAQGQIFDVTDLANPNPAYPKVVKVVANLGIAQKLQTEAEKLSQISHPGIPKIEGASAFFEHFSEERFLIFPCLVMEKIEGVNLSDWLEAKDYQPISQAKAIAWLKQLVDILDTVHSHGYLHRDIKPDNIMVRPNGQLVLIDFGIGRDETESYYEKQQRGSLTRAGTAGYQAPEQMEGRSRPASDFFSVGRTLVHLVTGIYPPNLPQDRNFQLKWRKQAPHISDYLADLLDDLMQIDVKKRDRAIQTLKKRIAFIETLPPKGKLVWRELPWVLVLGGLVSGFWIGVRLLGLLQPIELMAFDWMMRSRPLEEPDPRLVVIAIDEADIEYQVEQGMDTRGGSLSDEAFSLLLEKINLDTNNIIGFDLIRNFSTDNFSTDPEFTVIITSDAVDIEHKVEQGMDIKNGSLSDEVLSLLREKINLDTNNVIGLDLIRNFSTDPEFTNVIEVLGSDRFIASCLHPDTKTNHSGYAAPPEANLIGFADGSKDVFWNNHKVLRRHLLMMPEPEGTPCITGYALSTLVAMRYLFDQGFEPQISQDTSTQGQLILGQTRFQNLLNRQGPYQNIETNVQEIMLNYRATESISDIGMSLSLIDVLSPEFDASIFQNKIILIGGTSGEIDRHNTPLENNVPGVYVQAHEVSQIVSHVLDDRPLLNLGSPSHDMGLMLIVGMAIAPLMWLFRQLWIHILATLGLTTVTTIVCLHIFWQSYWLPVVPMAIIIVSYPLVLWWGDKYIKQYLQNYAVRSFKISLAKPVDL